MNTRQSKQGDVIRIETETKIISDDHVEIEQPRKIVYQRFNESQYSSKASQTYENERELFRVPEQQNVC